MEDETIFTHTGIRIMQAKNGDLLFCDPGLTSGVRDSLMVTNEMIKMKPEMFGKMVLEYIERHQKMVDSGRERTDNYSFGQKNL